MKQTHSRILVASVLASCMATAGAVEHVKVVPEGGLAQNWIVMPGTALAAPGYPGEFANRGDDVCVAVGYRVQPDGTTSDYLTMRNWSSSKRYREPAPGYWDAYSQAAAAALSQWRFAPKAADSNAAVDTVAVMTFRGQSSTRTHDELRGKCEIPNLAARMHVERRYESGRLEYWKSANTSSNYGAYANVREATQAASAWAAGRR